MGLLICKYANMRLLTRIQCKVSDTQVTVKACGPLVLIQIYPLPVYSF